MILRFKCIFFAQAADYHLKFLQTADGDVTMDEIIGRAIIC